MDIAGSQTARAWAIESTLIPDRRGRIPVLEKVFPRLSYKHSMRLKLNCNQFEGLAVTRCRSNSMREG